MMRCGGIRRRYVTRIPPQYLICYISVCVSDTLSLLQFFCIYIVSLAMYTPLDVLLHSRLLGFSIERITSGRRIHSAYLALFMTQNPNSYPANDI